jgi:hypothetical protein
MEGGGPTITCISKYQNNLGGTYLRWFYADIGGPGGLVQDAPYIIRMDTCDFPATPISYPEGSQPSLPLPKRQATGGFTMQGDGDALWMRDPRSESEGFVIMPLSPSGRGSYNGTLSISDTSRLTNISIIDDGGELLWKISEPWVKGQGSKEVQYEVQDDTQDLCVVAKADRSVDVSATFTATGALRVASSVPGPASGATLEAKTGMLVVLSSIVTVLLWI